MRRRKFSGLHLKVVFHQHLFLVEILAKNLGWDLKICRLTLGVGSILLLFRCILTTYLVAHLDLVKILQLSILSIKLPLCSLLLFDRSFLLKSWVSLLTVACLVQVRELGFDQEVWLVQASASICTIR